MRVYSKIGSKERFLEMFQGVNKMTLNEVEVINSIDILGLKFKELVGNTLNVKQTNVQVIGDETNIDLSCIDNQNNTATFTIKVVAEQGDQDGVYNITDTQLVDFNYVNTNENINVNISEDALTEFNAQHKNELISVASDYADFESGAPAGDLNEGLEDEFDNEAELADYVMGKYNLSNDEADVFAYDFANRYVFPATTVEVEEFYNELMNDAHLEEAYMDAVKKIDSYPFGGTPRTMKNSEDYGDNQPTNSNLRVKSDELDKFVDEKIDTGNVVQSHYNTLSPNKKEEFILVAKQFIDDILENRGIDTMTIDYNAYRKAVKELAIKLFGDYSAIVNETTDYPKEIGKNFKTKKQYSPEKKKRDTTTNISEEDELSDFKAVNVGTVVETEHPLSEILRVDGTEQPLPKAENKGINRAKENLV